MAKYCPECGSENLDSAKFCENCGKTMESEPNGKNDKNKKVILILIGIIAVLAILVALAAGGFLTPKDESLKLETCDFGYVTMLVPKGSNFHEYSSVGKGTAYWAIGYTNKNEHDTTLVTVWIGNYDGANSYIYDFVERDGDLEVYNSGGKNFYMVQRHIGNYYVEISGWGNLDALKEMANSIEVNK